MFQMTRRKRYSKLPLQANFYPMPSALYIEDDDTRLTLLSAQPQGAAALKEGQVEVSVRNYYKDYTEDKWLKTSILIRLTILKYMWSNLASSAN